MPTRVWKGDLVEVIAGKNRGQRGRVLSVERGAERVTVERVNLVKKHQKPGFNFRQGGIIEREAPIHLSNVMPVHKGERTRVGTQLRDGKRVRWSRRHKEAIDV
jgi:large subunit ribosomal protein L24